MDKKACITSMIPADGLGLEIGPSFNPLFPKRDGHRIQILDHAPRDELVAKYRSIGLPQHQIDSIEEVDYVWRGESLADLVAGTRFDYVVASHVIEHTVDPVGFLDDCAAILAPDGVLCLVVPDKRFCFDRFRPISSLGAVLDAHVNQRKEAVLAPLVDFLAYNSQRHGMELTWSSDRTDGPQLVTKDWDEVKGYLRHDWDDDEYIDIHRWTFTPNSFELLINDLSSVGFCRLDIRQISDTNQFEFYVGLNAIQEGRTDPPDSARRLDLLCRIEQELVAQAVKSDADEALRQELDAARRELDAVYASTSWRATSLFRRLTAGLRPARK